MSYDKPTCANLGRELRSALTGSNLRRISDAAEPLGYTESAVRIARGFASSNWHRLLGRTDGRTLRFGNCVQRGANRIERGSEEFLIAPR